MSDTLLARRAQGGAANSAQAFAKRQLQYGQAILLGIEFLRTRRLGSTAEVWGWSFVLPAYLGPPDVEYESGNYKHRWEAVESALRVAGITARASVVPPDGATVLPPR